MIITPYVSMTVGMSSRNDKHVVVVSTSTDERIVNSVHLSPDEARAFAQSLDRFATLIDERKVITRPALQALNDELDAIEREIATCTDPQRLAALRQRAQQLNDTVVN